MRSAILRVSAPPAPNVRANFRACFRAGSPAHSASRCKRWTCSIASSAATGTGMLGRLIRFGLWPKRLLFSPSERELARRRALGSGAVRRGALRVREGDRPQREPTRIAASLGLEGAESKGVAAIELGDGCLDGGRPCHERLDLTGACPFLHLIERVDVERIGRNDRQRVRRGVEQDGHDACPPLMIVWVATYVAGGRWTG